MHNLAFSRPSKSVFTISSLVCCDKTIHLIVLKIFVVLDIGLLIVNLLLYISYKLLKTSQSGGVLWQPAAAQTPQYAV